MMILPQNASNVRLRVFIQDSDGEAVESLVYNSSGLSMAYRRPNDSSWTAISLVSGGTLGTYTANTLVEDTNGEPGFYQLGLPTGALNLGSVTYFQVTYDGVSRDGTIAFQGSTIEPDNANIATILALLADNGGVIDDIEDILEDTGTTIPALINAIDTGSGGGARTVTVTVNDGSTVLQNAKVKVSEGLSAFVGTTNTSGVTTFNLDDATYTVAITKAGYSFSGASLVVDGNETITYSMTANAAASASANQSVGTIVTKDGQGELVGERTLKFVITSVTASETGTVAFLGDPFFVTTGTDGTVSVALQRGATYKVSSPTGTSSVKITIPNAPTFDLSEIVIKD